MRGGRREEERGGRRGRHALAPWGALSRTVFPSPKEAKTRRSSSVWEAGKIRRFRKRLLDWYGRHQRRLPWRSDPTPYRVWIAEIMLQQTRVRAALPYYKRFLTRFPNITALAAASEADVLEHWAGLGYYQRAKNLHRAARRMMVRFGGRFPSDLEEIRGLPGIGPYTAGAIFSIAFHQPEPVVDGNVRRVMLRLHGIAGAPERFFWEQAEAWLDRRDPSGFNQAMMELGALVCAPSRPLCSSCPVRLCCKTGLLGEVSGSPKRKRRSVEPVEMVLLVLACEDRIALVRQSREGFVPGDWGLPIRLLSGAEQPRKAAGELARRLLHSAPRLHECPAVTHGITHRRIRAHVFSGDVPAPPPAAAGPEPFFWASSLDLDRLLTSSLFRKGVVAAQALPRET